MHYVFTKKGDNLALMRRNNVKNTIEFKMSYETYEKLISKHDKAEYLNTIKEMIKLWKKGVIEVDAHSFTQNMAVFFIKLRDTDWILRFLTE